MRNSFSVFRPLTLQQQLCRLHTVKRRLRERERKSTTSAEVDSEKGSILFSLLCAYLFNMAGKSKRCIKSMCCICIFHCEHTFLCGSRHLSRSHSYILSISSIPLPLALSRHISPHSLFAIETTFHGIFCPFVLVCSFRL